MLGPLDPMGSQQPTYVHITFAVTWIQLWVWQSYTKPPNKHYIRYITTKYTKKSLETSEMNPPSKLQPPWKQQKTDHDILSYIPSPLTSFPGCGPRPPAKELRKSEKKTPRRSLLRALGETQPGRAPGFQCSRTAVPHWKLSQTLQKNQRRKQSNTKQIWNLANMKHTLGTRKVKQNDIEKRNRQKRP